MIRLKRQVRDDDGLRKSFMILLFALLASPFPPGTIRDSGQTPISPTYLKKTAGLSPMFPPTKSIQFWTELPGYTFSSEPS